MRTTTALVILDGFGINRKTEGNAIKLAKMITYNQFIKEYPHCKLQTSGLAVGLKKGQMGNSEVGHLTIGAGRVIRQDLTRIDDSIKSGEFFENKVITDLLAKIKKQKSNLHILGLVSDGGVHSHIEHLFAILKMAKSLKIENVLVHCFTDGRDTDVNSGVTFVKKLQNQMKKIGVGKIATITGRYYAMDREKNWDRTKLAYDAIVNGKGEEFISANEVFNVNYSKGVTDEFIKPAIILKSGEQCVLPKKDDGFLFFNFRKDRTKQLTESIVSKNFKEFKTKNTFSNFVSMTSYGINKTKFAFAEQYVNNILSEHLSKLNKNQLKLAEPTKYAHVTYFFNGEKEEPFKNEKRIIVPGKNVKTFDMAPEMSCMEIADVFCKEVLTNQHDFVLVNIANGDMVGHTGNVKAGIKAMKTVDKALKLMSDAIFKIGGNLLITADHGNVEEMIKNNKISTTHSLNPVPFVLVSKKYKNKKLKDGTLADIAPTVLYLLNLPTPKEYSGTNLILE